MTNFTVVETSAGQAVGYDLLSQSEAKIFAVDPRPRIIKRIGVTGSAVLGDAYLDIYFGYVYVGRFYPTTIGVVNPLEARDMMPFVNGLAIPANTPLRILVGKASTTNSFRVTLEVVELGGV